MATISLNINAVNILKQLEEIPTLRDCRRMLNKNTGSFSISGAGLRLLEAACIELEIEFSSYGIKYNEIDRIISKLGPRWPHTELEAFLSQQEAEKEKGEERQKDTDEVSEQSDSPSEEAEKHGGDGNSGEVDAEAETSSEEDREPQEDESGEDASKTGEKNGESGEQVGETGEENGQSGEQTGEIGQDGGEGGDDEFGESSESNDSDSESNKESELSKTSDDSFETSEEAVEGKNSSEFSFEYDEFDSLEENFKRFIQEFIQYSEEPTAAENQMSLEEIMSEDEKNYEDPTPLAAKLSHGGMFTSLESFKKRGSNADPHDIADIKRGLNKIFNSFNDIGGIEESPRISGKKLVVELVSRRCVINRARREELQIGAKLLMVDVSGSCSAACKEVLAAAAMLAETDESIVIVTHSNGHPCEVWGTLAANVKIPGEYEHDHDTNYDWWMDLLAKCNVIGCVNWGDWDSGFILEEIAQVAPLLWFDSYASTHGVATACRSLREGAGGIYSMNGRKSSAWPVKPVSWWQGVKDAATTAIALRLAAKEIRK